jgi:hypothetical protein
MTRAPMKVHRSGSDVAVAIAAGRAESQETRR